MTKNADITPRQDAPCKYFSERGESAIATTPIVVGSHYDIIVIGAGIVGLSAALALAERGVRVHVLEARHIGWGASGRAWGQVAAAAKHTPKEIDATFPPERAWRINETMARIPEIVSETVRRHDIQCEMLERGNLIAAHRPGKELGLRRLADDLARRGYPVTLLEDAACTTVTGSPRYRVALQDKRGIALNPLAYTRGLARAVLNAGTSISENTTVTQLERNAQGWIVQTAQGAIRAESVIIATNAFTSDRLHPGIGSEIFPVRAYQAISRPLDPQILAGILPERQTLNDTRRLFSGIRIWPDGRLHVGVDGPERSGDGRAFLTGASRRLRMTYPQLSPVTWQEAWGGWVDMTADKYPVLHDLAPGLWSAAGLSGRGIGVGTVLGRDLALCALGQAPDAVHPITAVTPRWYHFAHSSIVRLATAAYRIEDAIADFRFHAMGQEFFLNPPLDRVQSTSITKG